MSDMNFWEWFTSTASVDQVVQVLGLGTLAFLFARDLILTKAQHLRRVQDLIDAHNLRVKDLLAHHERERVEWQARLDEVRQSRDGWKEAEHVQRERANAATATVAEMSSVQVSTLHVLQSLNSALPSPSGGSHD